MTPARLLMTAAAVMCVAACSKTDAGGDAPTKATVNLRELTETKPSAPARAHYQIEGKLIPTPSDTASQYYLLRQVSPMLTGTIIAIIRQEHAGRVAYARVEVDCGRRLFHVLGVGNRRAFAETSIVYDGPLRPIEGLPLRKELAAYVCQAGGTPLATA